MPTVSDATTTFATPAGGWDPNSVVDFYKQQGNAPTPAFLSSQFAKYGLGNAASYSGTAAQNMALLAKAKGYSGTTAPNTISGSPSVQQGIQTNTALGSAGSAITSSTNTGSNNAAASDPAVDSFKATANAAITQAQNDTQTQINDLTTSFTTGYASLQKEKTSALAAADAEYTRANPYGSGSDKEEFLRSIGASYDTQLQQAKDSYQQQKDALSIALGDNITNINATLQSNILSYQQQQFTNQVTLDKLGISQDQLQISMDKLGISSQELAIAQQKLGLSTDQMIYTLVKAANPDIKTTTTPFGAVGKILGLGTKTKTTPADAETQALNGLISGLTNGSFGNSDTSGSSSTTSNGVDLSQFNSD